MIQLLPIVMGAKVEFSLVRGCITLCGPTDMGCVPVKEALSAMTMLGAQEKGGFGAGMMETRFEDAIMPLPFVPILVFGKLLSVVSRRRQ